MTEQATETSQPEAESGKTAGQSPQTFTQADVDKIVRERVARERSKYADYDELKNKAGQSKTLEDRVAEIERAASESEKRALRAEVANAKGLTPTQAKRLIGGTREELEADADDLLKDIGAQMQKGNTAPKEGGSADSKTAGTDDMREFARGLFKTSD